MPRPPAQQRRRRQVRPDQLEPLIDPVTHQIAPKTSFQIRFRQNNASMDHLKRKHTDVEIKYCDFSVSGKTS
ncbi:hypothetical protein JTE90_009644 [Oedothorax gibbosus]|uniref:Uncharacterized protein n=1 Tax=Oedothorax gibbosus TaxID=931172 RepID=A0AAV6VCR2_9ARAC|nr:hypothetical protein JTE90_009644 [Oedothorax gibbosus]